MSEPKLHIAIDAAKFKHDIDRIKDKKKDIAKKAVFDAGDVFNDGAKELAPYESGDLMRSIDKDAKVGRKGPEVHVGSNLFYAKFQELGTSKNRPHPFIRPALRRAVQYLRLKVR